MKIIHTADIHLGSKMDSRFTRAVSDERKKELRNTFRRMVEKAKELGVSVIMLCGDVFDSDKPFKRDKDFFYEVVRSTPEIDFLYLKGNHDLEGGMPEDLPENLKLFSDKWTSYDYGDVVISGVELCEKNARSYYSSLALDRGRLNIVMLHGQADDSSDAEIPLKKLRDKNIDYLALGHIHKPKEGKLDERGVYAYCGCLEGRGFDDAGEHGFVLIDTDGGKITRAFVPFAERLINAAEVDISGCADSFGAYKKVKSQIKFTKKDLYRIELKGDVQFDNDGLAEEIEKWLSDDCYFASVKDHTSRKIDVSKYQDEISLRGEFIRSVYAADDLTDDEKTDIITRGLRALGGN